MQQQDFVDSWKDTGGLLDVYEHNFLQKCTVEEAANYDYNKSSEGDII
jgi:hypothetical protein